MNVDIKNIHTIYSLLTNHSEKVISIIGNAENMKAQEVLELAHKKGIKIQPKNTKISALCKSPNIGCLLYTSPSPRDVEESRMPSSA